MQCARCFVVFSPEQLTKHKYTQHASTQRGMRAMTGIETRISFQWPPQLRSILLLPNAAFVTTAHDSRADTLDVISASLTVVPCPLRRNHNNYFIYSHPLHWNGDKSHTYNSYRRNKRSLTHHTHTLTHASARIVSNSHITRLDKIDVDREEQKKKKNIRQNKGKQRAFNNFFLFFDFMIVVFCFTSEFDSSAKR